MELPTVSLLAILWLQTRRHNHQYHVQANEEKQTHANCRNQTERHNLNWTFTDRGGGYSSDTAPEFLSLVSFLACVPPPTTTRHLFWSELTRTCEDLLLQTEELTWQVGGSETSGSVTTDQ